MAEVQRSGACVEQGSALAQKREEQLARLLNLSQSMLLQAKAGDWAEVMHTGSRRQRLLEAFFERSPSPQEACEVANVLRGMLQVNDEIETLALNSRTGLEENIGSIQQGRRAVQAYASNAGRAE